MKKLLTTGIFLAAIIMFMNSCEYKYIVEPVIPPPDPTDTIKFSMEIEPIFTDNGCIACHPGFHSPDLSTGNSYNSITSLGLVNTDEPEISIIYVKPDPAGNHSAKYNSSQSALVLQWIQQGALDN